MYLLARGKSIQLTQPITFSMSQGEWKEKGKGLHPPCHFFFSQHSYGCYEEMMGWDGSLSAQVSGHITLSLNKEA